MSISPLGFIDYKIPPYGDEDSWRIEAGERMLADFDIEGGEQAKLEQVVLWHGALSEQPRMWQIVCRLFAVTPMYGVEDMDLMQPWTFEVIADRLQMSLREVEASFTEAKGFWRRWRAARIVKPVAAPPDLDPDNLDEATIEKLLLQQGFIGVDAQEERRYIARRILELEAEFQQGSQRSIARSLVEQECQMFFTIDRALRSLTNKVREITLRDVGDTMTPRREVGKEIEERIAKLTASRINLQSQIESTMKSLGIAESQTGGIQKRGAFKDCLSTLVEAVADYEARGDRALIDGVFTAAEIEILTEEYRGRNFQYRPDLPIIVPECIEALFDPNYSPPKLARMVHRRLLAGFRQALSLARSEAGVPVAELDAESAEEKNEALASAAERDGDTAVLSSGMARAVARVSPPPPPAAPSRQDRLADY